MRKKLLAWLPSLLLVVTLFVLAGLFLAWPMAWQIEDDEGAYLYQAWRTSRGEWPYRDFLSAQQPLFVGLGGLVMRLLGPSQATLRLLSRLITLTTALLLGGSVGRAFARPEAGVAAALIFLAQPDLFHAGRLYLSEPYMLLGCVLGLAFLRRWRASPRRRFLLAAGVLFALATMFKLFAVLSWAGAFLYIGWTHLQTRPRKSNIAADLALFVSPALAVGAAAALLQVLTGSFFASTVGHHLRAGSATPLAISVMEKAMLFREYALAYPYLILLALVVGFYTLLRREVKGDWLAWQLVPILGLLFIRRDLGTRHFLIFLPALAGLSGAGMAIIWPARWRIGGALLALALVAPWVPADRQIAQRVERQTAEVVALLQQRTRHETIVLADYLELNFLSQRRTIPLAAGLHHTSAASGQITAEALIEQLGSVDKPWVLLDISPLTGSTLVGLRDYPTLHLYLREHFRLQGTLPRDHQQLQVWEAAGQPPSTFESTAPEEQMDVRVGDLVVLSGYTLEGAAVPGQRLTLTLYWEALSSTNTGYSVFVHLQAPDGTLVANWDGEPLEGLYPTWRWRPGQHIPDPRGLLLPLELEPGFYHLSVGVYDWRSGERLPAQPSVSAVPLPEARIPLSCIEVYGHEQ